MTTFCGEQTVTRKRPSTSGYDSEGYPAPLTYTNTTGTATINPVPGEELMVAGIGDHFDDAVKIITSLDLSAGDDRSGVEPDLLVWVETGETYRIVRSRRYTRVIPHTEAYGVLEYD